MFENWFYTYEIMYYDDDDTEGRFNQIRKARGLLQAASFTDAFEQIKQYYGEGPMIDVKIHITDLEGFSEAGEESIKELSKILNFFNEAETDDNTVGNT